MQITAKQKSFVIAWYSCYKALGRTPTQKEVGKILGVSPPNVNLMLKRLVESKIFIQIGQNTVSYCKIAHYRLAVPINEVYNATPIGG